MKPVDLPTTWRLARRTERMNPSVIREILKLTERPGVVSLAGGLPSADTLVDAIGWDVKYRAGDLALGQIGKL